jgi:hypothetical protein
MVTKINKKAQVTIFVILGIVIVASIILLFVLLISPPQINTIDENNPQSFIESCVQEALEGAVEMISENGGDISPRGYLEYNGTEITYLCYISDYYETCINQRPLLIEHFQNEINEYIKPKIADCFLTLKNELENRYDIETSKLNVATSISSKNIHIKINKKFKMARQGSSFEIDEFNIQMNHPIYDLLTVAIEVVNQEARFCNFDELGYMILFPEYDINKFVTGDDDAVYTLTDTRTNKRFRFAVRSCVLPAGL